MHTHKSVLFGLLIAATFSANAQLPSFEAEIDCGGLPVPGDAVPFQVRFENQTLEALPLDMALAIDIPVVGNRTLREDSLTLGPDQDLAFRRQLNLPQAAPNGDYTMSITASSPSEVSFDTCSFNVQ